MANQEQMSIEDIAKLLPIHPEGLGWPISDRTAWGRLGAMEQCRDFVRQAEQLIDVPLSEVPDELYLGFIRSGNRINWQKAEAHRRRQVKTLVLAECIENKGRFLPAIEHLVHSLCAERTWIGVSNDKDLTNFRGEEINIDLWSSTLAWNLATADWILGNNLSPEIRQEIRQNIRRRVLDPFRKEIASGESKYAWWRTATHNWNTVALAGVTGAALQQIESPRERAEFVADAINFSQYYLKGFKDDGYCSEGLGYWNFGFSHYILLSEMIGQATGRRIDLLTRPLVSEIAKFGSKIQIMNEVYPAFADCPANAKPDSNVMRFVSRRWNPGTGQSKDTAGKGDLLNTANKEMGWEMDLRQSDPRGDLGLIMTYVFENARYTSQDALIEESPLPLRDWFDRAGILISRPATGSSCRMGVAMKGGNNGENHNHNDVGSYFVVLGNKAVLVDPGSEQYTARTFSPRRYESKALNSFGHAVPIVAGQLQRVGAEARAEVLKAELTDQADTLEMQIRSAYPVDNLKSLVRSFVYSRQADGYLTVADHVEFSSPQSFGTALITSGTCKKTDDGGLLVQSGEETLRVTIDAGDEPFEVKVEEIKEDTAIRPTRIGINLENPVRRAAIKLKIEPISSQ